MLTSPQSLTTPSSHCILLSKLSISLFVRIPHDSSASLPECVFDQEVSTLKASSFAARMDQNRPSVPIIEMLLNSVDLPEYPFRRKPEERLTTKGAKRKRAHVNSRSVKNVAPVHFLVRGDPGDLVRFGKSMATAQLSIGNFHSTNHVGNRSQALVDFQPAEKDNALIHGVETAAVMSGYLHVVYNTTRITEPTLFRHPHNGQLCCMSNIMNLPENTIGFDAKARKDRTMNDGTIRKAGERDTFSLRCDDKLSINLPRDRNHPMSANNMRLQTILPWNTRGRIPSVLRMSKPQWQTLTSYPPSPDDGRALAATKTNSRTIHRPDKGQVRRS